MDPHLEVDSDDDSSDGEEVDQLLEDYLNNTPDIEASTSAYTPTYTEEQLKDIDNYGKYIELLKESETNYKELEATLYKNLAEVREKLRENQEALIKETNPSNENAFSYLRSGRPYFKDKQNSVPPDNEDTIVMKQAQMYDFSQVSSVPGWTVKDKQELMDTLLEFSREIKKKNLKSEIARLRRENGKENLLQIVKLERELTQVNKMLLKDIALPLDQEYDWDALSCSLNRRHSAHEYRALWKLFFHPSINKSTWSKTEHQQLQRIATSHNLQNWNNIAKELNTNRSGYQCFVYYRTNMIDISTNRKWTSEEVEYLQRTIDYFREGTYIPWGSVASAMDNRTKIQVYNKYTRMTEFRKGRFLEEEDVVLLKCYQKFESNFKRTAEYLPGRSPAQLRTRFNLLMKYRLSKTWTVQDDRLLIQVMANMGSNYNFAEAATYFPGKDRMHIRSRYKTLSKWMKSHPATDISMAPRRGARRLVHGYGDITLEEAVENLNKKIEAEVQSKKSKGINMYSPEEHIEDGIMAILTNENIKEEAEKKSEADVIKLNSSLPSQNSSMSQDMINLHKLLVFMRAVFDAKKFDKSKHSRMYSGLKEATPEVSLLKVKSYSKKQAVQTIKMNLSPDVWGNIICGNMQYVLPPNYSTITGCRTLMKNSHDDVKPEDEVNLSFMARKNVLFKDCLAKLRERFTAYFLWPILLSNEGPALLNLEDTYVPRIAPQPKFLPQPDGVTIPPAKKTHLLFQARQTKKFEVEKSADKLEERKRCKVYLMKKSKSRKNSKEIVKIFDEFP